MVSLILKKASNRSEVRETHLGNHRITGKIGKLYSIIVGQRIDLINIVPEKNVERRDLNPFSVSSHSPLYRGAFAEHAVLLRRSFLYRTIDIHEPFVGQLTYNGWWFRQTVEINGQSQWFRISWLKIHSQLEFTLPEWIEVDPAWGDAENRRISVEIGFSRGLTIRRFRIWLAGRILYDEIA